MSSLLKVDFENDRDWKTWNIEASLYLSNQMKIEHQQQMTNGYGSYAQSVPLGMEVNESYPADVSNITDDSGDSSLWKKNNGNFSTVEKKAKINGRESGHMWTDVAEEVDQQDLGSLFSWGSPEREEEEEVRVTVEHVGQDEPTDEGRWKQM